MSSFVLTLSVGPVQGFIAAARRSRDLWAGSWLLSELAKAVARELKQQDAELVFPFIERESDLEMGSDFSVGNKIQAVIHNKNIDELIELANCAKQAANTHFQNIAQKIWEKDLSSYHAELRKDIWDKQVHDYVEVQYAWAEYSDGLYLDSSQKAAALLAARKATRDFLPLSLTAHDYGYGLPKSSLDGARETVLQEEKKLGQTLRRKLGLSKSEQLDCAGVVKRLCGNPEQFTPITRIAADSWIEEVKSHLNFEQVKSAYEALVKNELATRVQGNHGKYSDFPYDAQFLYSSRLEAERIKAKPEEKALFDHLRTALKPIWKDCGEPCPYWVMLLADGDRMGELLDKAKSKENHQKITKQLSSFAQKVPEIMRENRAHCVYSGGDDVLGFASLTHSVKCAEDLKDEFFNSLKPIADELNNESEDKSSPTLSVGLAICHINTPLGSVRALAKRAEKEAKGDHYPKNEQRNGLGITLSVRGGITTDMRLRWDNQEALSSFGEWIAAYRDGGLSSRVAYDSRDIFIRTDFPMSSDDVNLANKIRAAEFTLMLSKAKDSKGRELDKLLIEKLQCRLKAISGLNTEEGRSWENANDGLTSDEHKTVDLDKLAVELITARWLAAKTQRDLGREN